MSKGYNSSKIIILLSRQNIMLKCWLGLCVWLLAVCAFTAAQHETLIQNCSTQADQLSAALKVK